MAMAAGSAKVNWDSDIDQEEGLAMRYLAGPCLCNLQGLEAESTLTSRSLFVLTGSVGKRGYEIGFWWREYRGNKEKPHAVKYF